MGFTADEPPVAGTVLVRSAIQSPNYVAGVSGWAIFQDGTVEFNNATIRGSLIAGGGAVTLDSTGLRITGGGREMTVDTSGQFLVKRTNGDGAYAQLTLFTSASTRGGAVFVQSIDPTPGANDITAGTFYADLGGVIADEIPMTVLQSQYFAALPNVAVIYMGGQSSASAVDNTFVKIGASRLQIGDAVTCTTTTNGPVTVGGAITNSTDSMTYMRGQRYTINVTNASVAAFTQAFVFPTAFPVGVVPNVHLNINDIGGSVLKALATAVSITNTGFTLRARSADGTVMGAWAAVAVQVTAVV